MAYTEIEVSSLLPAGMPAVFDDKGFTIERIVHRAPVGGSVSREVVRSAPGTAALNRTKSRIAHNNKSFRGRGQKKQRTYVTSPADAIPRGTCNRCGLIGSHASPAKCIDALRSVIADLK
jgi:hypothetical protein